MKKLFIIAALGALVLTACKEKEQLLKEIEYAVTLDNDNLVIPVGVEVQLNAAVLPEDAAASSTSIACGWKIRIPKCR